MALKDRNARREYHRNYMRERFAKDPNFKKKHLARVKRNTSRYIAEANIVVAAFKSHGCALCPEDDPCCISAHHVDPKQKEFEIGRRSGQGYSADSISAELQKCIPLCENCHRKVHAGLISLLPDSAQ
jgi:hypothetical protein